MKDVESMEYESRADHRPCSLTDPSQDSKSCSFETVLKSIRGAEPYPAPITEGGIHAAPTEKVATTVASKSIQQGDSTEHVTSTTLRAYNDSTRCDQRASQNIGSSVHSDDSIISEHDETPEFDSQLAHSVQSVDMTRETLAEKHDLVAWESPPHYQASYAKDNLSGYQLPQLTIEDSSRASLKTLSGMEQTPMVLGARPQTFAALQQQMLRDLQREKLISNTTETKHPLSELFPKDLEQSSKFSSAHDSVATHVFNSSSTECVPEKLTSKEVTAYLDTRKEISWQPSELHKPDLVKREIATPMHSLQGTQSRIITGLSQALRSNGKLDPLVAIASKEANDYLPEEQWIRIFEQKHSMFPNVDRFGDDRKTQSTSRIPSDVSPRLDIRLSSQLANDKIKIAITSVIRKLETGTLEASDHSRQLVGEAHRLGVGKLNQLRGIIERSPSNSIPRFDQTDEKTLSSFRRLLTLILTHLGNQPVEPVLQDEKRATRTVKSKSPHAIADKDVPHKVVSALLGDSSKKRTLPEDAHTVRLGETLRSIANNRLNDVKLAPLLAEINELSLTAKLKRGQKIHMPSAVEITEFKAAQTRPPIANRSETDPIFGFRVPYIECSRCRKIVFEAEGRCNDCGIAMTGMRSERGDKGSLQADYSSNSAMTGAWSEGRSNSRISRAIITPVHLEDSASDVQI